ncbi:hypothetical protein AVT69_gp372 [Pseudomonas phage PhiPA3]|uniref:Uncharacterized protein 364 n=1 Tax=Pseudomonas phage PhiPA3 TaxID=998086 RepID=F8SJJ6_BPPA3|nr:hypothetical protein AVT69_gp372 [Pseudomonas phage PhiPA3]AEH03787.1 hypothetical protein [Pseudomonas phage PhiPA3]
MVKVAMLALVAKVGLFGITNVEKSYIQFDSMPQCLNHLEIQYSKFKNLPNVEIQRTATAMKVSDNGNYTVYGWRCDENK